MDIGFSEAIEEELDSYVLEHVRSEMLEEIMVFRYGWIVL